ncbi:2-amino-4-hydroxy-6-hydroxymethyldihydropteridine diphosphokinase [Virgibacillus soli]|uniref:2-amino-4-hydroxy-6-hydroxymethyldihydropteridine diphosphokinase n=1 Tax=Paracerasibacillus soli TaxID=480284 RepID=A0ABU5CVY7_9BACI|nr:2-amino-4-hydroxy-6-hydroxymethyldihydropteridine diphosphokinase [Virgibacillus soli]MDY0410021.1 2-amino-4-hydroxy-6-hydroxymethyldihydropteridine diphosphokinase [Virgibacillus soli]
MKKAFIALGTNIEPRNDYLKQAIQLLDDQENITIIQKSSVYETAPVGYTEQADFLNLVLEVETSLPPHDLLDVCQAIENKLGRKRVIRFGPRTIDLDILEYNNENIQTDRLTVPHPRIHERAFVLVPLDEISPGLKLPTWEKPVNELLRAIPKKDREDVKRWNQKGLDYE